VTFDLFSSGCGANLKGRTGTFQTPNYPNPYPVYKECIWTIEVDPGQRVELTFEDMDIETTLDCRSDNVEVRLYFYNTAGTALLPV
jgi:cubilin